MRTKHVLILALLVVGATACTIVSGPRPNALPQTQLQTREFQTREFDTNDVKLILKAMLNVLQDDGFVVKNAGKMMHEMVIGTRKELDEHAVLMIKFPNMEHDEPYMAHVDAGKQADIIWHFNRPGEFEFACLIAGHYQAGMRGKITVRASRLK
jgi:hypothetical protein